MKSFVEEVRARPGGDNLNACIQCGVCTGSCPVAGDMEYPPRKIIAMIRAEMRDEVLSSNSMWHCLSCYLCSCRCPRDIKPTELAHALESLAIQHGFRVKGTTTPAFYRSFVSSVKGYGRVHEFGMMLRFYVSVTKLYLWTMPLATRNPLAPFKLLTTVKMLPLGLQLFLHKRMPLLPEKVKGKDDLSQIIQKFREIKSS